VYERAKDPADVVERQKQFFGKQIRVGHLYLWFFEKVRSHLYLQTGPPFFTAANRRIAGAGFLAASLSRLALGTIWKKSAKKSWNSMSSRRSGCNLKTGKTTVDSRKRPFLANFFRPPGLRSRKNVFFFRQGKKNFCCPPHLRLNLGGLFLVLVRQAVGGFVPVEGGNPLPPELHAPQPWFKFLALIWVQWAPKRKRKNEAARNKSASQIRGGCKQ